MKLFTIQNGTLTVVLDGCGAVLHSIRKDGAEYLWQGDSKYWKRRDANLFPYVGRLTEGVYTYRGQRYALPTHGFCIGTDFAVTEQSKSTIEFCLEDSEETYTQFPFHFGFRVRYTLEGNSIRKTCVVENRDEKRMRFGIGSHPGFQVPLGGQGDFSDWYLEFPTASQPERIEFDPSNYRLSGAVHSFPLTDGQKIPLTHELFDLDAVVLSGMPRSVSIRSDGSDRSVTVAYPDMPFLGLWHAPKTDAPYVCIEPWVSLPSHSAYVEDLEGQAHLIPLEPGQIYQNEITITLA